MKIRAFALLVLLPIFVNAMETHEEQPLLQAPPTNKMEKFNKTVDTMNQILEGDVVNNQAGCAMAIVARVGYEGCCGITLGLVSILSCVCVPSNPPVGIMTGVASVSCLTSAMRDSMYMMDLTEVNVPQRRYLRFLYDASRTLCCILPRKTSNAVPSVQSRDEYEEV